MDDKIIATFCLCDDLLKAIHHYESPQCQMNDAEVMTTALVAALFYDVENHVLWAWSETKGYASRKFSA